MENMQNVTVALNALLTGRTGDAALVTNEGFEDLVEIDGGDGGCLSIVVGGGCCGTQGNQSIHH